MMNRLPSVVRSVRGYSTSSNGLDFLSGLMKRIDNLNLDLKTKQNAAAAAGASATASGPAAVFAKGKKLSKPQNLNKTTQFQSKVALGNKGHPMLNNRFEADDRKQRPNNYRGNQQRHQKFKAIDRKSVDNNAGGAFLDARPQQHSSESTSNTATKSTTNASRNGQTRQRPQGTQRMAGNRSKAPMRLPRAQVGQKDSVVKKTLVSKPLVPSITGDHFLYGKPAAMGISLLSRVAAVAKRSLLDSKYPYKLPRSIIDQLEPRPTMNNRFLLKKDFNLDVPVEPFVQNVNKVVKGETEQLVMSKNASTKDSILAAELMRNQSLTMEQKQHIFDMTTGLKTATEVLKTAAWK